jgi:hypothetical protein
MDLGDDHDRPKQSAKRDPKKQLSKNGVSSELPPLFVAADQNKGGYVSKDEVQKDGAPCSTLMLLIRIKVTS